MVATGVDVVRYGRVLDLADRRAIAASKLVRLLMVSACEMR